MPTNQSLDHSLDLFTADKWVAGMKSLYTFLAMHFVLLFSQENQVKNYIHYKGAVMSSIRSGFSVFVICLLSNDYIGSDNGYLKPIHVNL